MKRKLGLFLLALLVASTIKATEVYVCDIEDDVYMCSVISSQEKSEPDVTVIDYPNSEEATEYDYR